MDCRRVSGNGLVALLLAVGMTACGRPDAAGPVAAASAAVVAPALVPAPALAAAISTSAAAPAPGASPAASNASADSAASAASTGLPADVVTFRTRRDDCDHFRGEEAYDAERKAFLKAALQRTCTGTDRELAALRRRHAANPAAVAALRNYEDRIE